MKKKRIIKAGVLIAVFLMAVLISSLIINRGNDDAKVDLGDPTLPRISFMVKGEEINHLQGYVNEMNVSAMRDTITPIEKNGNLEMLIEADGNTISGIFYDVYSLDGQKVYASGTVKEFTEEAATLKLSKALKKTQMEAVLRVGLQLKDRSVYFYTRIIRPTDIYVAECLEHAKKFHEGTFAGKNDNEIVTKDLIIDNSQQTYDYQHVTLSSDVDKVTWGKMKPEIIGDVEWNVQEANSVYTSLLATYQVSASDEKSETDIFNVKEFYRVRYTEDTVYLQNFDRTINQVFDGKSSSFVQDGIRLGIVPQNIPVVKNETAIAFVTGQDLWSYNVKENKIALVFSFANREGHDKRGQYDQHDVKIIDQDQKGNLVFAVYGYMNRGKHEGEVGADIYYYDAEKNMVQEKAFIPSDKSFVMAQEELGEMVYYDQEHLLLYVLAGRKLLQADLEKNKQKILEENIEDGQYVVSEDNHLFAFLKTESSGKKESIKVMNLRKSSEISIEAENGEHIKPLGFIDGDFIYGVQKVEDQAKLMTGDIISPMYELRIVDSTGKVVKQYSEQDVYITAISINGDQVTVNRVKKSDGQYVETEADYISSSKEKPKKEEAVGLYYTEDRGNQCFVKVNRVQLKNTVKILRPKQIYSNRNVTIEKNSKAVEEQFYVYGLGTLQGIYKKAGEAVQKAEQVAGVVVSERQSYIWQKGNRLLACDTQTEEFKKKEGQSSLEACEAFMEKADGVKTDLTGCRLDQIFYVVNLGKPVIAIKDKDHAVLITGYDLERVYYIDPDDGSEHGVYVDEMEEDMEAQGNIYIGYLD